MLRAFTLLCVFLFPLCSVSLADNTLKRSISATATQTDNKITVDITVTETGKTQIVDGKPLPVTTTENMKGLLLEGTQATMVMEPATSSTKSNNNFDEIDSGTRMDVLSIKGTNTALIVVRIIEHGAIIWADSKTIDVTVKAANDGK